VLGAQETCETPVLVKSWRNIGQSSLAAHSAKGTQIMLRKSTKKGKVSFDGLVNFSPLIISYTEILLSHGNRVFPEKNSYNERFSIYHHVSTKI